jgi:hypothetical protein
MIADRLPLDVHLSEFNALRSEMLEWQKRSDNVLFFSLVMAGALFTYSFSASIQRSILTSMAIYFITPLSTFCALLWILYALRIRRIAFYTQDVLVRKINLILKTEEYNTVFAWETSQQGKYLGFCRRMIEIVVCLMAFVGTGISAQYLIWPFRAVEYHCLFYWINWLLISLIGFSFTTYLFAGKKAGVASGN